MPTFVLSLTVAALYYSMHARVFTSAIFPPNFVSIDVTVSVEMGVADRKTYVGPVWASALKIVQNHRHTARELR